MGSPERVRSDPPSESITCSCCIRYACMYVCMHVCMYACMHVCIRSFSSQKVFFFSSPSLEYMSKNILAARDVLLYTHTHTYIYIYIYIQYTYIHIRIHIQTWFFQARECLSVAVRLWNMCRRTYVPHTTYVYMHIYIYIYVYIYVYIYKRNFFRPENVYL